MNNLLRFDIAVLDWQGISSRLALTLLHFIWQGAAAWLLLVIFLRCLRTARASTRYMVSYSAMLSLPVIALSTFVWCEVPPQLNRSDAVARAADSHVESSLDSNRSLDAYSDTAAQDQDNQGKLRPSLDQDLESSRRGSDTMATDTRSASLSLFAGFRLRQLYVILSALYTLGAMLMLWRMLSAVWSGQQLRLSAEPVDDSSVLRLVAKLARQLGLSTAPAIAYTSSIAAPAVIGIVRPMILLPGSLASSLSTDELAAIIGHEMAHIRRFDLLANLGQKIIESLLFFHPAVWWMSRQVSAERENCCDDLTVATGFEPVQYVGALLHMAELCVKQRGQRFASQLATLSIDGGRPSELGRRVERLLGMHAPPRLAISRLLSMSVVLVTVVSIASVVSLAQVGRTGDPAEHHDKAEHEPKEKPKPQPPAADNEKEKAPPKPKKPPEKKKQLQQDASLDELIAALTSDDFSTRVRAVDFIGYRGAKGKPAVPALIKMLEKSPHRESVLHALKAIGPSATEAIPALYESLSAYPKQPATRWLAADALAHIGEPALPTAYKGLKSENIYELIWCHAVIAKIEGPQSSHLGTIAKLMNSNDKKTSHVAVQALTMIGPIAKPVIPQIIEAMDNEVSPKADLAVLLAQFRQDSRPAIPQLVKLLDHSHDMTQQRAAYALSTIGGTDILPALPGLVRMLGAKRSFVREMAAKTLGETGPTAKLAIDPIIKLLSDEDEHVRAAAATAIGKIGPKTTKVHLALAKAMSDESGRVRSSVAPALAPHAPINEQMIQVFIKAAEDNWRGVTDGCETFFRRLGPEHKKRIPARFDPDNPQPRG